MQSCYRCWFLECWSWTERGSTFLVSCPSPPTTATTTTTATSFGFFTCCCCWSGRFCQSGSASRTTWLAFFSLAANLSSNADGWPVKKDNIKTKRDLRSVSWRRHGRTQQMSFKTKYHLTFSTSDHDVIDGRSQSSYCDHIGTTDLWQYQVIYNNNRRL